MSGLFKRNRAAALAAACASVVCQSAIAGTYLTPYARSGQSAEGTPANWTGLASFPTNPFLEDLNRAAFVAQLTGAGVNATNDFGIWAGNMGALTLVAREGGAAAGIGLPVRYDSFTSSPIINNNGDVLFQGNLTGAGVTPFNDTALWAGAPAT